MWCTALRKESVLRPNDRDTKQVTPKKNPKNNLYVEQVHQFRQATASSTNQFHLIIPNGLPFSECIERLALLGSCKILSNIVKYCQILSNKNPDTDRKDRRSQQL